MEKTSRFLLALTAIFAFFVLSITFWRFFSLEQLQSSDFELPSSPTPNFILGIPTVGPEGKGTFGWQSYTSKDHSFHFLFPAEWKIIATTLNQKNKLLVIPVQSWTLINYVYDPKNKSLPENAVKMDFEITIEGRKRTAGELIDCSGQDIVECKDYDINGVCFKGVRSKNSLGVENLTLVTVKEDKIYRISITVNSDVTGENKRTVEKIMDTFEILQSS